MADRVIQRNDTAARWQSINPILATGEIGIEIDGAKGYKIGDGKTRWNDLPYPANPTNVVQELGNSENAVPSQKLVTEKLSELGSEVGTLNINSGYVVDLTLIANTKLVYSSEGVVTNSSSNQYRGVIFKLEIGCKLILSNILSLTIYKEIPSVGSTNIGFFGNGIIDIPDDTEAKYGLVTINVEDSPKAQCIKRTAYDELQDSERLKLNDTVGQLNGEVKELLVLDDGIVNLYKGCCYNANGELITASSYWSASPIININRVLSDNIELSESAIGVESSNICSIAYFDSEKRFISCLFSSIRMIKKNEIDSSVKYVSFSFYEKDNVVIKSYSNDYKIQTLQQLIDENKQHLNEVEKELGFFKEIESHLTISSETQYLCSGVSVNVNSVKILVTMDAKLLSNRGLYYNVQYGDNTWMGQKSITPNVEVTVDSGEKKFKDISVFVVTNSLEEEGIAIVRITSDGIKRDILDFAQNIVEIENKIDELSPTSSEYWESDNLWDESRLAAEYLWSNSESGTPVKNSNWRMTDYYIPVKVGSNISIWRKGTDASSASNYISAYIAEYDKNKNFIKRDYATSGIIYEVLEDVAYIKMSIYIDHAGGDWNLYSYATSRDHYFVDDTNPPFGLYNIRKGTKLQNKVIVYFGDSQIGFGGVTRYLANLVGGKVYNVGFGGCRMAAHGLNGSDWDCFSMYRLAEAIASKDFSYQEDGISKMPYNANHQESFSILKSIDFNKVDIIIIHYGTNDWTSGATKIGDGNQEDRQDLKGMVAYTIETILTAYPHIRIVFDSLTYRKLPATLEGGQLTGDDIFTATNAKGNTIPEYNNAIKEVCDKYLIQFNDLFVGLFNKQNIMTFTNDGIHPNDKGRYIMASRVANML